MPRNQCQNASLDWCPISGTRLEPRLQIPPLYRIPCTQRLRRDSVLIFLRASQKSDRECVRQFSSPACQSGPLARRRIVTGVSVAER